MILFGVLLILTLATLDVTFCSPIDLLGFGNLELGQPAGRPGNNGFGPLQFVPSFVSDFLGSKNKETVPGISANGQEVRYQQSSKGGLETVETQVIVEELPN